MASFNLFTKLLTITPYTMLTGFVVGTGIGSYNYQSLHNSTHPYYDELHYPFLETNDMMSQYDKLKEYTTHKNNTHIHELITVGILTGLQGSVIGTLPISIPIAIPILIGRHIANY